MIDRAELKGVKDARNGKQPDKRYKPGSWAHVAYSRAYAWVKTQTKEQTR